MSRRRGEDRVQRDLADPASRADAALAFAGLLLLLCLPRPETTPEACVRATEVEARKARSVAVRCGSQGTTALRGPARLLFDLPIDPNRADLATLEVLPGIGTTRAQAILVERDKRPFENRADLERVRGIGPRTAWGLRGWVGVDRG